MTTYGLLALLLVGLLASPNSVLDPHPDTHGMDMSGHKHYLGYRVVSGIYRIGGEGELYFALDRQASQDFSQSGGRSIDVYVGDRTGAAFRKPGISGALNAIDMEHIRGLSGRATVKLSGGWTGIFEDRREYISDLVQVIVKTPAKLEGCSGVIP